MAYRKYFMPGMDPRFAWEKSTLLTRANTGTMSNRKPRSSNLERLQKAQYLLFGKIEFARQFSNHPSNGVTEMPPSAGMWPLSPTGMLAAVMPIPIEQEISRIRSAEEQILELLRRRNGTLDRIYYHVEPEDLARAVQKDHQRGSIIVVPPDKDQDLLYFADAVEFLDNAPVCEDVIGISVAGVGSSPIGAVALARDVATAKKGTVAAIVSGYGVDDCVYEGLGGFFFLRETNRLEFALEQMNHAMAKLTSGPAIATRIELMDSIGSGPDLVNLKSIIRSRHLKNLRWLVGHSKGNLLVSSAISELVLEGTELRSELANVRIVFLSALSALPQSVGRQHQIIGDMDVLGWLNSPINIEHKLVPGAMHHLNRNLPFHLNAQEELSLIA